MTVCLPSVQFLSIGNVCEPRRCLLVTSSSAARFGKEAALPGLQRTEFVSTTDWDLIEACRADVDADVVIGLGGGAVMDIARLRGAQLGAEVTCIPTLLSTDAFLCSTTALRRDGRVTYVPSVAATRVVIDEDVLIGALAHLNALGCCDVLSILTASEDWLRDASAGASEAAIEAGRRTCNTLLAAQDLIAAGSREGIRAILAALVAEVLLCAEYGTDRIEEGSEHYFAYALEARSPGLMHGALVGLGILASRRAQGLPIERLLAFMVATGIAESWRRVSPEALLATIKSMADFVTANGYPQSVWNAPLATVDAAAICDDVMRAVPS